MQYDFWNNPLVVSAMRLKYRRSSPGITTCLYLLVLLTIGAALHHYQGRYLMPPGRAFLLVILGLQFMVSGALALFTVANSINAEVANRTLDFQRIVSLRHSVRQDDRRAGDQLLSGHCNAAFRSDLLARG